MSADQPRPATSGDPYRPRDLGRWLRRKEWSDHVGDLAELAATPGFRALRARIVELAEIRATDTVLDVGAGTGLLTLAVAPLAGEVIALDVSRAMSDELRGRLVGAGVDNVEVLTASAAALPVGDGTVDVVVSNYCYHHLNDADKEVALAEARRVLSPDGRLVIGDMMFRVGIANARNRTVVLTTVANLLRRGPAGILRLAKHVVRYLTGRWEHPADADWWQSALGRCGFASIVVETLEHEGGIAMARRPPD